MLGERPKRDGSVPAHEPKVKQADTAEESGGSEDMGDAHEVVEWLQIEMKRAMVKGDQEVIGQVQEGESLGFGHKNTRSRWLNAS